MLRVRRVMPIPRIFLLSPASMAGKRAAMLLRSEATFPLAMRLRNEGASLGEVFTFASGLYFRGKLSYASTFGASPASISPVQVITSCRGLLPADHRVHPTDLREMGAVPISAEEPRYREPLVRDVRALEGTLPADAAIVLLGSVASGKYLEILLETFGDRLHFPREFVGRGDMSRGGLLLRAVQSELELEYVPAATSSRRGTRPPKLT